jgi:hypothetical protein
MGQQSVRQAARRSGLDAQAERRGAENVSTGNADWRASAANAFLTAFFEHPYHPKIYLDQHHLGPIAVGSPPNPPVQHSVPPGVGGR